MIYRPDNTQLLKKKKWLISPIIENKLNKEAGKADKDANYSIQNYMKLRREK